MTASDTTVQWLIDGARSARTPDMVLDQLCNQLMAEGLPLWRVAVFVRTLHPDVGGRRFMWRPGHPVEIDTLAYERKETDEYRLSPFAHVYANGLPMRRRLFDPVQPLDYALLEELRAQGATDYFATPLLFSNGEVHMASWTTQRSGGFSDAEIAVIE